MYSCRAMKQRQPHRKRRVRRPHTIVFFVASAKELPIPSGGGYVFARPGADQGTRLMPRSGAGRPPALRPAMSGGVGLRFWQISRAPTSVAEEVDALGHVLRLLVPRSAART